MNNINYNFTETEVAAVAKLIALAKSTKGDKFKKIATIVAIAFNREALKELGIINDKYNPLSDK
jgi:hypothetical protein